MNSLLEKIVKNERFNNVDIANALLEICEKEHSSCSYECPVYEKNEGHSLGDEKPFEENRGCDYFKNGFAMLKFLRSRRC